MFPPSIALEDPFPVVAKEQRMRAVPGILRKNDLAVGLHESLDRVGDEPISHEDLVAILKRYDATVEQPMDCSRQGDAVPWRIRAVVGNGADYSSGRAI